MHEPWKVYKATYILDRYILWPLKSNSDSDSDSLACISRIMKLVMAHENIISHESIIKKPWKCQIH